MALLCASLVWPGDGFATHDPPSKTAPTPYLEAARAAARWIDSRARETEAGLSWRETSDGSVGDQALYYGNSGVVRFWLEAWRHTGEAGYLERARRGGDHLLQSLPPLSAPELHHGLYVGWSGVAWTLEQLHRATGDVRYRDGAMRLLSTIHADAREAGRVDGRDATGDHPRDRGVHWGPYEDAISPDVFAGSAGVGLLLLWAAEALDHPPSVDLAARAGRWLLEHSHRRLVGRTWPRMVWEAETRVMPNFSHGAAGISYFLASLYEATGEREFLDGALAGAWHLRSIAETGGGEHCLVFHEEGDGEDRHYLGFCHGPVGTTRLFEKLYQVTGDQEWRTWADRGTRAILDSGIPEQRTPGFWNNVSQCCGSAGVIEHFVARYRNTGNREYLELARRIGDDVLARASERQGGLAWVQAEHRIRPEDLEAQVGFMQGAAGVGTALLHLDAAIRGLEVERLRFVDDPW